MAGTLSGQLKKQILSELQGAVSKAAAKTMDDMNDAIDTFYSGGQPKKYIRTGALGDTPRTTPVQSSGNTISFTAYLDTSHVYSTADQPSMGQVLDLANYGIPWQTGGGGWAHPTVGSPGFWEEAQEKMKKTIEDTLKSQFG